MPGESFSSDCPCETLPGTSPPATTMYVVTLNDLVGHVTLAGTGSTAITSSGNTITIGLTAAAGLGSVTSVAISSPNTNLVVSSGSPITTNGTIVLDLAGNLDSISDVVMAADTMLYATGAATFTSTTLTSFARTILDDANAAASRSTLGLVIGTNVQAFSQDLSDFVTFVTWSGDDMTSTGGLTLGDALNVSGAITATGTIQGSAGASFSGDVTAATFTGSGANLTNLDAGDISAGTLAVARGGTGLSSYTVGQVLYASAATTISGLTAGAAGTFLRFAGAGVAPVVSTLILPNAATTGDIFMATSANTMGRLANVATGSVLLSGGVGAVSTFGKVTSSHVNSTIPTMSSGISSDLTGFTGNNISFADGATFNNDVTIAFGLIDGSASLGTAGDLLSSTGTGVDWTNQITVDTITINTRTSVEGTLTPGGTTGAQTINKPSGTVRFAAAASSLVVTNNLCTTSDRVLACVCTNDTTAYVKNVVTTNGAFTITLGAAATAETEVYWQLLRVS